MSEIKKGWIRFMDELPEIGKQIIVAVSLSTYNGASFLYIGYLDVDKTINADNCQFSIPIYDSENFDIRDVKNFIANAHHWAYNDEINKGLKISQVCEYERKIRGEKYPVFAQ